MTFPSRIIGKYLPPESQIPKEFWRHYNEWNDLASTKFYRGGELPPEKNGIDRRAAFRHISACLGSYDPSHEHKIAGVSYLMSLWFKSKAEIEADANPARPGGWKKSGKRSKKGMRKGRRKCSSPG
jgi:hypothetical protein